MHNEHRTYHWNPRVRTDAWKAREKNREGRLRNKRMRL